MQCRIQSEALVPLKTWTSPPAILSPFPSRPFATFRSPRPISSFCQTWMICSHGLRWFRVVQPVTCVVPFSQLQGAQGWSNSRPQAAKFCSWKMAIQRDDLYENLQQIDDRQPPGTCSTPRTSTKRFYNPCLQGFMRRNKVCSSMSSLEFHGVLAMCVHCRGFAADSSGFSTEC